MRHWKLLYRLSCLLLITGCLVNCHSSQGTYANKPKVTQSDLEELEAQYLVYHLDDETSRLYYDISNELLMYRKPDSSGTYYSHTKIELKVIPENSNVTEYSDTTLQDAQQQAIVKHIKGSFNFKLKAGFNYKATISVIDYNKNTIYSQTLNIEKLSTETRQNFLITDTNYQVLFTSYFAPQQSIYIFSQRNNIQHLEADAFNSDFKLAPPPFSNNAIPKFNYKPDSTFLIYKQNNRFSLQIPASGFLHLKTNSKTREGLTCFVYEQGFPKIKNNEQMIQATRYIMAKKEFDKCNDNPNKKAAIDYFWLDIAGNNERAKELIRKYYLRVQDANQKFTSYQEGWKTDRGMIYIVFGKPTNIQKRENGELWTYGFEGNPMALQFAFVKIINLFTDNDYYLERTEEYKERWYQAVDMWRQGRIYLDR